MQHNFIVHKTFKTRVPKQLVLKMKIISDSIREHENCNLQTLNILPLQCVQEDQHCPQNSHPPIFKFFLKGVSLHFPPHLKIYYSCRQQNK
jgi:hypothetical protein